MNEESEKRKGKRQNKIQQQKQAKSLRSILVINPESGYELESVCVHTYPRGLKYQRIYMDIEQSIELILLDNIKYEVFKNSTPLSSIVTRVLTIVIKLEIKENFLDEGENYSYLCVYGQAFRVELVQ